MKKYAFILLLACCCMQYAKAQTTPFDLTTAILGKDSLFWKAYNQCDQAGMQQFLADDIEFYHDKGGPTFGIENMIQSIRKGLCANSSYHLRREAVPGTVHVYPMQKGDSIYGAIISGEHYFYITQNNQPEFLDGHARFTHLWLQKKGVWKMARILSFDHGPAYISKRKEITLSPLTLRKYAGKYNGPQNPGLMVREEKGKLILGTGERAMILYPESAHLFFSKERDLTFEFGEKGTLRVRERGIVVEELVREK